jgi:hypothetical protein
MPFGTILDPIFSSPTSDQVTGYTRCGDSALWTGAYLAAESFRYNVTRSADALRSVKGAHAGLKALTDVTGDNRLARCMVPANSPYAAGIQNEQAHNTIHSNPPWCGVEPSGGSYFGHCYTAVPNLSANNSNAFAISNSGQVVGLAGTDTPDQTCITPSQVQRFEGVIRQPNGSIQRLEPVEGDTVSFAFWH